MSTSSDHAHRFVAEQVRCLDCGEPAPPIESLSIGERGGGAAAREVGLPSEELVLATKPSPPPSSDLLDFRGRVTALGVLTEDVLVAMRDEARRSYHDLAASTRAAIRELDAIEVALLNKREA
jgi:hypothetical protein